MLLTDSVGIREETTFGFISFLKLGKNRERLINIEGRTNTLVPFEIDILQKYIDQILEGTYKSGMSRNYGMKKQLNEF